MRCAIIRGAGAIPRRSRRGYAPSLENDSTHHLALSFGILAFNRQAAILAGRNWSERSDSEPSFGGRSKIEDFRDHERRSLSDDGLSAHVTRWYPKGQSVNAPPRRVCLCRLLEADHKVSPSPLTPAGVPVAKITPGCPKRLRIGVTATWHGQQSTGPTLWDYSCPKGLVVT